MVLIVLIVLALLAQSCVALYREAQEERQTEPDAAYNAAADAWNVILTVRENSIVIPQLAALNTTCEHGGTSVLMKCSDFKQLLENSAWRNEPERRMHDICDIRSREAAQAVQNSLACALASGFLCVQFPYGLQIQNNRTALQLFAGPTHELPIRLLHVTYVANMFMVHTQCLRVLTRAPQLATAAVSLRSGCVERGLQAPSFSSMRESGGVCVWYCITERVRWPWNSDPPAKANSTARAPNATSTPGHVCRPVPENFVAVDFVLHLELSLSSVVPRLLQPQVLQWLDAVSDLAEHHMQQRAGLPGFITVLSVPGSVYHTHELTGIAPAVIRAREAEYDSIALHTEWRGRRFGRRAGRRAGHRAGRRAGRAAARRRMGSTVLAVQGLHIFPAMLLSDAAYLVFTEEAVHTATAQAREQPGVLEASLSMSTVLHRRKLPPDPPAEVIFSGTDVKALVVCVLLVLCACLLYDACDTGWPRKWYLQLVLRVFG